MDRLPSNLRLQDFLSDLAGRRNGLHISYLQLVCVLASRVTEEKHQYIKSVLLLLLILLVYDAAIVAQAPSGRRSHRCDYDHKVNLTLNANFNASCNVSIFDIASGRSSRGRTWQKARRDRQEKVETAAAAILRLDHNGK